MTEIERITAAEFARRAGCSSVEVRRQIRTGKLKRDPDFLMDASQLDQKILKSQRKGKEAPKRSMGSRKKVYEGINQMREGETPEGAAERIVKREGRAPYDLIEAERVKENFLALLRQLEYDIKSGEVVPVAEVHAAVAVEYGIVRSRIISLAAEVAPRVAMIKTAPEVQDFLEREISKVLEDLSLDRGADATATVAKVRARTGRTH